MVDHILDWSTRGAVSGLCVAVISGVLESLVEATPARMGRIHLRALYDDLGVDPEASDLPKDGVSWPHRRYYRKVLLSDRSKSDLRWWRQLLLLNCHRSAYSRRAGVLTPTWGDGSGTGTGGTVESPGAAYHQWMGVLGS